MGYGLGAAIGAKTGRPDKTVVNIAGDGCFRMNMNEIATAVRCGRPLVQIVLNNHVLGMVRQWQTLFYDHRYSHTVLNDAVDFVKISEGMGAKAIRVTKMEEVEPALKEALSSPGPVVLDCWIDQDLSVFPMVPAGASIDDVFERGGYEKMSRVYNFSAGPAVLPEAVLKEVAEEMMDYQGSGMSVMEMSHRSPEFQKILDDAEKDLTEN